MRFVMVCENTRFLSRILLIILRSDPDKDTQGWGENDRGVSFTFGADVVAKVTIIRMNSFSYRLNSSS